MRFLIWLVSTAFSILNWLIIIRVIISWLRPSNLDRRWRKVLEVIYKITEPILAPIRSLLPTGNIGIDFSPIVALFALMIVRNFVINILRSLLFSI